MSVQAPYRAVICGEEHIVKGWRGRKLVTDKGSFFVRHIYKNWQIQDHRILEVATIQSDGNGDWLVNGQRLSHLASFPEGQRFSAITTDERLRIYRKLICAAAWCQHGEIKAETRLLDSILAFWKAASLPASKPTDSPQWAVALEQVSNRIDFRQILPGWGGPIWLTEFRLAGKSNPLTPEQKQLAKTQKELQATKAQLRKVQSAASDTLKEALKKWYDFAPAGMAVDTQARIEKAVKLYMTNSEMRSVRKIASQFKVSHKTVSLWFKQFTEATSLQVVTYQRHESVRGQFQTNSEPDEVLP